MCMCIACILRILRENSKKPAKCSLRDFSRGCAHYFLHKQSWIPSQQTKKPRSNKGLYVTHQLVISEPFLPARTRRNNVVCFWRRTNGRKRVLLPTDTSVLSVRNVTGIFLFVVIRLSVTVTTIASVTNKRIKTNRHISVTPHRQYECNYWK